MIEEMEQDYELCIKELSQSKLNNHSLNEENQSIAIM